MEADIRALEEMLTWLVKTAVSLRANVEAAADASGYEERAKALLEQYSEARESFNRIALSANSSTVLPRLTFPTQFYEDSGVALLDKIRLESHKALGALAAFHKPLSQQELDKLTALRRELEKAEKALPDDAYGKNIARAIEEYEAGHFLASALISSRVIVYILQSVEGKDVDEKVRSLVKSGTFAAGRDDVRQSIIKASNKSRNFLSHDIRISAEPSDSLALLGDAIKLLSVVPKAG